MRKEIPIYFGAIIESRDCLVVCDHAGDDSNYTLDKVNSAGAAVQDDTGRFQTRPLRNLGAAGVAVYEGPHASRILAPGDEMDLDVGGATVTIQATDQPEVLFNHQPPTPYSRERATQRYFGIFHETPHR